MIQDDLEAAAQQAGISDGTHGMSGQGTLTEIPEFIQKLEAHRLYYSLTSSRKDAIMVTVAVPGEIWEIEFIEDGTVDVERFKSAGSIGDRSMFPELFDFADPTS